MAHAFLNADNAEKISHTFDFADLLAGATISSRTINIVDSEGTTYATLLDSSAISGNTVTAIFKGQGVAANGDTYKVQYLITTSDSKTYTKVLILRYYDKAFQRYF